MGLDIQYSAVGVTDPVSGYNRIHIFIAGDLSEDRNLHEKTRHCKALSDFCYALSLPKTPLIDYN